MIGTVGRVLGQTAGYTLFAVTIAWFSTRPAYQYLPPDTAVIKLSLTHPGQRVDPCHDRTPEELAKLPPNMRSKQSCSRERYPVQLELDVDGKTVFAESARPAGLSKDGASRFYYRFSIPAGAHHLRVRMRDSGRMEAFDYAEEQTVHLEQGQILVVDYASDKGKLIMK